MPDPLAIQVPSRPCEECGGDTYLVDQIEPSGPEDIDLVPLPGDAVCADCGAVPR